MITIILVVVVVAAFNAIMVATSGPSIYRS